MGSKATKAKGAGRCFCWGYNGYGRIGDGTERYAQLPFQLPVVRVTVVACGAGHTLAATEDGALWAWGKNYLGQLGVGDDDDRHVPTAVAGLPAGAAVVAVDGGDNYSAAVTADGRLWSTGCGYFHANAQPDERPLVSWKEVTMVKDAADAPIRVVGVACGGLHGLALADNGAVFGWGNNEHGQVGVGSCSKSVAVPTRIDGGALGGGVRVAKVVAKKVFSLAIAADGRAFVWGGEPVGFGQAAPALLPNIRNAVVSADVGVAHGVVCCSDGSVFCWGTAPHGDDGKGELMHAGHLGQGRSAEAITVREPTQVQNAPNSSAVGAGMCHTLMLEKGTGRVWLLGDLFALDHLAQPHEQPWCQPALSNIVTLATSVHHVIAAESL